MGGAENDVYASPDGKTVLKRNNLSFHASYLEYFERLALHNWLFPEAKLHLVGFDDARGQLNPVTSQDFVDTNKSADPAQNAANAKAAEQAARQRMVDLGFKKYIVNGQEAWFHPQWGIVVEDLHDQNMVHDQKGNLVVFDPVIYPEPKPGSALERLLVKDGAWPIQGDAKPAPHDKPAGDPVLAGDTGAAKPNAENLGVPAASTWYLTRFLLLRWLGLVYAVAFLIAARQIVPLIGENGLTPAGVYMALVRDHFGSGFQAALNLPSFFWLGISDHLLAGVAWAGFALSLLVLAGYANAIIMALLWATYMSYVHIGQIWYSYGWEIQTLETGFLAIFLCPLLDPRPFSRRPPPIVILWLYRWLGFRIMLGAGLIKLRGDACWRDLTCLYYHYQTQPLPNPLSRLLQFAPHWFQKFSVLWNHFIELVVPWFSFGPRLCRRAAGVLMISFQFILIASGNLAFLNWLTIVPFIACLDDGLLRWILPGFIVRRALGAAAAPRPQIGYTIASGCVAFLVACLSVSPVLNLFSGSQVMNGSFDPLDLVNTYGAFGSVGRERPEIVFEGTQDDLITAHTQWKEYEFPYKPGNPMRRPPIITPYYGRLDWQIWFAAMASPEQYPWTLHFVWKLLHNDPGALSLLANNPFPDAPPHYIRARLYKYEFAPPGDPAWWHRELIGEWLPALTTSDLEETIQSQPWLEE